MSMMQYEVYKEEARHLTLEINDGLLENREEASEFGISVRVLKDGRLGSAYSTNPKTSIEELLKNAETAGSFSDNDPDMLFPKPRALKPFEFNDNIFQELSSDDKIELLLELESSAKAYSKKIKAVRKAEYEERISHIEIKNSYGIFAKYSSGLCCIQATCVAEDGNEAEWAFEEQFSLVPKKLSPKILGQNIAYRATALLGGRKVKSCKTPCVIDRRVIAQFLSFIAPAFFADSVSKGKSPFKKPRGKIYSQNVTIVEDATMQGGYSTVPFDSQGSPTVKTLVVKNGSLNSFLTDAYYAKKTGLACSGSSFRPSAVTTNRIGIRNFHILPGLLLPEEMEKKMGKGLVVTNVMGLHTANQVTGDFSLGASGFWVENGARAYPVKGITIAGNFHKLFSQVEEVGLDMKFWLNTGAPSIMFKEVAVSGS